MGMGKITPNDQAGESHSQDRGQDAPSLPALPPFSLAGRQPGKAKGHEHQGPVVTVDGGRSHHGKARRQVLETRRLGQQEEAGGKDTQGEPLLREPLAAGDAGDAGDHCGQGQQQGRAAHEAAGVLDHVRLPPVEGEFAEGPGHRDGQEPLLHSRAPEGQGLGFPQVLPQIGNGTRRQHVGNDDGPRASGEILLNGQEDRSRGQTCQSQGRAALEQRPGRPPGESPGSQNKSDHGERVDHGLRVPAKE